MNDTENSIGASIPRRSAGRLVAGQGSYTDDIVLPGMLHVAFFRSASAHSMILEIDIAGAMDVDGVVDIIDHSRLIDLCKPLNVKHTDTIGYHNAPQPILAVDEVAWVGMPILAIVAETRASAEDALDHIFMDVKDLPIVTSAHTALELDAAQRLSSEVSNLAYNSTINQGDIDAAFFEATYRADVNMGFGRQTGVPLEPRSIIAQYHSGTKSLEVIQSHQAPHQMREIYAEQLGLDVSNVSVRCPDVGGAFGVKLHAYPDEIATVAIACLLGHPVKFIADRLESFVSDIHAREADVSASIALDETGRILAIKADSLFGLGAYSSYPRGSIGEVLQAQTMIGAPYSVPAFQSRVRAAYLNKPPSGAYRGVGQPIAVAVTEQLMDAAATVTGIDPAELRSLNYAPERSGPSHGGLHIGAPSLIACQTKLLNLMDYEGLRAKQRELVSEGRYRGIGLSTFVEMTGVGSALYGQNNVNVAAGEGCTLRFEVDGSITCLCSATDQGQGTTAGIAQIVAGTLGIDVSRVHTHAGDTKNAVYGGGAWASRGIAIGGEAARQAAVRLKDKTLAIAGALLSMEPVLLDLRENAVISKDSGMEQISLKELVGIVRYRQHMLPPTLDLDLTVTRHYVPQSFPYMMANGMQAAYVEVDTLTGLIKLLGFWVVEDCGRVINPLLVDEQIRGGVVQGIGAVLYEHCHYDEIGQLLTGSLVDYGVPMSGEMPDIVIAHVETFAQETGLGARGVGEAGTVGAVGALWGAVNDALKPMDARMQRQPFTPETVIGALIRGQSKF